MSSCRPTSRRSSYGPEPFEGCGVLCGWMVDNSQTETEIRGQLPLAAGAGGRNVVGVPEEPGRDPGDCIKGPLAGFLRDISMSASPLGYHTHSPGYRPLSARRRI